MFSCEREAIDYIDKNRGVLLTELRDMEVKTLFTNENTEINVMRSGKKLIKCVNSYGDKEVTDIFREMIDLRLTGRAAK